MNGWKLNLKKTNKREGTEERRKVSHSDPNLHEQMSNTNVTAVTNQSRPNNLKEKLGYIITKVAGK